MIQTPYTGASPTTPADLMEGLTQIVNQATKSSKWDETAKQMMKNIKIFDGSNKAECINWISQVEAAAKFTNTPFLRINLPEYGTRYVYTYFSELSAMANRRGHQGSNPNQLLRHPKHHRGSYETTEHPNSSK